MASFLDAIAKALTQAGTVAQSVTTRPAYGDDYLIKGQKSTRSTFAPKAGPPSAPFGGTSSNSGGGSSSSSGGGSYGGGGGSTSYGNGGGSSSGGGGYVSTPVITPPAPTTETITIPDPKADATYKTIVAQLARQLGDFKNTQALAGNQYNTGYDTGLKKLGWMGSGWDNNNITPGSIGAALNNNTDDFAGRGVLYSSGYADQGGQIANAFNQRKSDLDTAKKDFFDTQANALANYQSQNTMAAENAERDAIARIAAQLGIQQSQVTPGKTGSFQRPVV